MAARSVAPKLASSSRAGGPHRRGALIRARPDALRLGSARRTLAAVPAYFLDLPGHENPIAWDPHRGPLAMRADTRYFGAAFVAMEAALDDPDLAVYLTWNVDRLPAYGPQVIAVVLGDESGRRPRYAGRVRAVFKAYGSHPELTGLRPDLTGLVSLGQYGYRWLRWLSAAAPGVAGPRSRRGACFSIPPGTFNQLDLPVTEIAARGTDLFFAGSIEHGTARQSFGSAKVRARREMLTAVSALQRDRPRLRSEIRLTAGFQESVDAAPEPYSRAMMDARICLAPRGTSPETFRILEGLRCGCVVVCESLPRRWFYTGAPLVALRRWRDLPRRLAPLLDDPAALADHHRRSVAWWQARCSEAAIGRYMAACLNGL